MHIKKRRLSEELLHERTNLDHHRRYRNPYGLRASPSLPRVLAAVTVEDTDEANYPFSLDVTVKGMTCEKCVGRVQNALNAQPGTWARVDLGSGMAHILAKSPIDRDAVERAVEDAGYYVSHRD